MENRALETLAVEVVVAPLVAVEVRFVAVEVRSVAVEAADWLRWQNMRRDVSPRANPKQTRSKIQVLESSSQPVRIVVCKLAI
jgi:hypothetical protein